MKLRRLLVALSMVLAFSSLAPTANAMTCEINDDFLEPGGVGDAVCAVVITAVSPVCAKFGCG